MNFQDFINMLVDAVSKLCDPGESVTICETLKNNSQELKGIAIKVPGKNVVPTIYVESMYERYKKGTELSVLAREVVTLSKENRDNFSVEIEDILDYDKIKDRIVFRLISTERNGKLLENLPHRDYNDLSVVYYIAIENVNEMLLSTTIQNKQLEMWRISEDDLYEIAMKNYKRVMGLRVFNIFDIVDDSLGVPMEESMYVATNTAGISGAAVVLLDEVLQDFYEKHGAFYILPSSTDEVIFVTAEKVTNTDELVELVKLVNSTEVDAEHVLSDSIYFYEGNCRSVRMIN